MSPKRNIESLYGFIKAKLSQHLKNETSVDEGEGGGANENECPILCSAPTLFRSTATVNSTRYQICLQNRRNSLCKKLFYIYKMQAFFFYFMEVYE